MKAPLKAVIFRALMITCALVVLGPGLRAATAEQASFSGINFEFPGFGQDGYKTWDVQGNQFSTTSAENAPVDITGMKLLLYSGGPALALETTIESPQATVLTGESQAHGSDQLDIIGSNSTYEAKGFDWTWDGKTQVIHIGRQVQVLFTAAATASATPSTKSSQPITITSDTLEIHQEVGLNRFLFSGHVLVTDGDCQTRCDTLEVRAERSAIANPKDSATAPATASIGSPVGLGVGRIEQITASDHVDITQGDLEAHGDKAELVPSEERVVLSGSPQIHDDTSDALLEGGQITWLRDQESFDVEPLPGAANGLDRVKVTLPPLASYQNSTANSLPANEGGPRLVITGESLRGQFGVTQRRFDMDKSVRVEDPSLNVSADHLDAEFDPPTPVAATTPGLLPGAPLPRVGRLNHLATTGGVTIDQFNRTTTTQQAEILPDKGEILLTGAPHVVDTLSRTTIDGNRIELSTDGRKAVVAGIEGQPAQIILTSLPGISSTLGADVPTTVVADSVTMDRGDEYSNFTFTGRVHITARDLDMTCGELDAYTQNTASQSPATPSSSNLSTANALDSATQMGQIQELIARDFVEITQRRANTDQFDYRARAARADIHPLVAVINSASQAADAATPLQRTVELFGDPTGATGPVRPEVEVPPTQNLGLAPTDANANTTTAPVASAPTVITSDQQWLMTSPVGSTYYFEGNVQIDGGSFTASCDKMRAEGAPVKSADGGSGPGPVVLNRVIAEGQVKITQGTRISTAGKALILPRDKKIELSNNVVVVDSANGGSRWENANLEISNGEISTVEVPAVPGQPLVRPTMILTSNPFDKIGKPANKPAAGTSP